MINPLGDAEKYNRQKNDFSLDNYYEVDYLRGDNYEQVFNSLNKQEGTQKKVWEDWATALNDYDWLILIVS